MKKKKPKIVEKDWGREIWIANDHIHDYCGKILQIYQGYSTSLHFHIKKNETFYITKGTLQVDLVDTREGSSSTQLLYEGDTLEIRAGTPHRLIAYDGDVEFIEASTFHMDSDSKRIER